MKAIHQVKKFTRIRENKFLSSIEIEIHPSNLTNMQEPGELVINLVEAKKQECSIAFG
jgi:hypothetical protein